MDVNQVSQCCPSTYSFTITNRELWHIWEDLRNVTEVQNGGQYELKCILHKQVMWLWNGIKWLRIACSGRLFENMMKNPCVPQRKGIWQIQHLSASQELYSTKLVSGLVGLLVTITLPNTYESKRDYYMPWNFYKTGTGFRQKFPQKNPILWKTNTNINTTWTFMNYM